MALNIRPAPDRAEMLTNDFREDHRKLFLLQGMGLLALGSIATALPHLVSLVIDVLIGWLLFIAGLFRFGAMAAAFGAPGYWSSMLLASAMIVFGTVLALFPSSGIPTLEIILTAYFVIDGWSQLNLGQSLRPITKTWLWGPVAACIDVAMILSVFFGWPAGTGGLLGAYLGTSFLFGGVGLISAAIGLGMAGTSERNT